MAQGAALLDRAAALVWRGLVGGGATALAHEPGASPGGFAVTRSAVLFEEVSPGLGSFTVELGWRRARRAR